MRININELNDAINLLIIKLKESKGNTIEMRHDFYWDISSKEIYNPYEMPKDISIGQLSDDLNEILDMKNRGAVPYDLKRIANILIALSIENPVAF